MDDRAVVFTRHRSALVSKLGFCAADGGSENGSRTLYKTHFWLAGDNCIFEFGLEQPEPPI